LKSRVGIFESWELGLDEFGGLVDAGDKEQIPDAKYTQYRRLEMHNVRKMWRGDLHVRSGTESGSLKTVFPAGRGYKQRVQPKTNAKHKRDNRKEVLDREVWYDKSRNVVPTVLDVFCSFRILWGRRRRRAS
jgi:hypothetical protein